MKFQILLFTLLLILGGCTSEQTANQEATKTEVSTTSETTEKAKEATSTTTKATSSTKKEPIRLGKAPKRLEMQETIEKMHENLMTQMTSGKLNPKDIDTYYKESELYMSIYGDTLAAEYVFNAADLYHGIGDYDKAIEMWHIIYKTYRDDHPKAPHAMFQSAFAYDGALGRKDLAKNLYIKFLKTYPDHELAKDATALLKNLNKSPEDLIKEFQKKNAQ